MLAATTLLFAGGVYAQTCSGGSEGGMDATGCDCNTPTSIDARRAPGGKEPSVVIAAATGEYTFQRGLREYEKGHYDAAMTLLKTAAQQGDARAAEVLALMYRFGRQLFSGDVRPDPSQAARFADLAARLRRTADIQQGAP
jgi:TPR repeat protein